MKAQPRYQIAATLYHEATPGHHVETCIAHEMEGLPTFRRFASYAAFSEGWGLYSELLPKEMGLYADPYSDFGRLDRKSVVSGQSVSVRVDLGGGRFIKK